METLNPGDAIPIHGWELKRANWPVLLFREGWHALSRLSITVTLVNHGSLWACTGRRWLAWSFEYVMPPPRVACVAVWKDAVGLAVAPITVNLVGRHHVTGDSSGGWKLGMTKFVRKLGENPLNFVRLVKWISYMPNYSMELVNMPVWSMKK